MWGDNMATKKISELTNISSVQDTDLLIVETAEGTRSVSKRNIIPVIPTTLSSFDEDATHRLVTDTEKSNWNNKQTKVKTSSITLLSSGWSGSGTFLQAVAISGALSNSKIDLQPNDTVLNQLIKDKVSALYIENNNGVFTAKAVGAKPTSNLTIQVTITEVG